MKPAEQEGIHELLPWYVAGTLDPEETSSFREHLADCPACREELLVVTELRGQLERHGRDWIGEHPTPQQLVAVVHDEDAGSAPAVRRHLELCATCALEARWIRGEETSQPTGDPRQDQGTKRSPWRFAGPALAAAAGLLLGLLLPFGNRDSGKGLDLLVPTLIAAPMRGSPEVQKVLLRPGQPFAVLHIELDFPPEAFPLTLEILDEHGKVAERWDAFGSDKVYQGANLLPILSARPGRYTARIVSSNTAFPPLDMPFELVAPANAH